MKWENLVKINKPIELWNNEVMQQKLDYLHNNPVEAGLVEAPWEYYTAAQRTIPERKV